MNFDSDNSGFEGDKKALVLAFGDPKADPRPLRMKELLIDIGFRVFSSSQQINSQQIRKQWDSYLFQHYVGRFLYKASLLLALFLTKLFKSYAPLHLIYRIFYFPISDIKNPNPQDYDLIVVHDLQLLPYAFAIKKNAFVIFDAREYYTRQNDELFRFRYLEKPYRIFLCEHFLKKCDLCLTVSPGLASAYYQEFDVEMELFMSVPNFHDIRLKKNESGKIRMVHHGMANPNRQIEKMIEIAKRLDEKYSLDLYLVGNPKYIRFLKNLAKGCDRIKILTAVSFQELIPMLSTYDIGLSYFEPKTFNLKHCLPNKFFEFIQARLAVVAGPSPDIAEIIERYKCGYICEQFTVESMVDLLNNLDSDEILSAKRGSHTAASILCYEQHSKILRNLIINASENMKYYDV